ncbi:MAG: hypothetical protein ACRETX_00485 [Steroidobacteraceae bacterium]
MRRMIVAFVSDGDAMLAELARLKRTHRIDGRARSPLHPTSPNRRM